MEQRAMYDDLMSSSVDDERLSLRDFLKLAVGMKPSSLTKYEISAIRKRQVDLGLKTALLLDVAAVTIVLLSFVTAFIYNAPIENKYESLMQWTLMITAPFAYNLTLIVALFFTSSHSEKKFHWFSVLHCIGGIGVGIIWGAYPAVIAETFNTNTFVGESAFLVIVILSITWCYPIILPGILMTLSMLFSYFFLFSPEVRMSDPGLLRVTGIFVVLFFVVLLSISVSLFYVFIRWALNNIHSEHKNHLLSLFLQDFEENSTDWLWQTDKHGYFNYVSTKMIELTGLSFENLQRIKLSDLFDKDDAKVNQLESYMASQKAIVNLKVPASINGERYFLSITAKPIHSRDGSFKGFRGVTADVTEIQLLNKIQQDQKDYESFIKISSTLSHDFNNILASIMLRLEYMKLVGASDEYLDESVFICQKAAKITSQMLAYSKKQSLSPENVSVNRVLGVLLNESVDVNNRAKITYTQDEELYVWCDETLFYTSLDNVMKNAVRATENSPKPHIHIEQSRLVLTSPDLERRLDSGEYIRISISDNGSGFTEEDLQHAFEPFYTQNRESGGSGLGLSMVQGFSNQSGGNVILSNTEQGAQVDIYLISGNKCETAQESSEVLDEELTVLLVEDTNDLRELIVKHLSIMNINILNASSVEEGKEMLNAHDDIDLVLSDFLLEDGKGSEVVSYARDKNPDVKILYISGFLDEAITNDAEKGLVLRKPFTMQELTKMLNKVLSED